MTKEKTNTLLVTGGAGFIGSCFVDQAVNIHKDKVVVLDALTYAGHMENLASVARAPNFHFIKGTITDSHMLQQLMQQYTFDAIVSFAAESHVDQSINNPGQFIQTNIVGTYTLLEAARHYYENATFTQREAFRFVHISTDEVYGSLGSTGYFTEQSSYLPNSPYSASKAASDHLVRAWHKTYQLPTIITNCSNNYGPRQYPEKLIPLMIIRALAHRTLPVYGDGMNVRDWIHVEDHCRGVRLALEKGTPGETYCFGGSAEKQNIDLIKALCTQLDLLVPLEGGGSYQQWIRFVKDRPGHDRRYAINSSKASKKLGFKPRYTFEEGLKQTVTWYLENQAWCNAVTHQLEIA